MTRHKKNNGFTLIEMVIYISLFAIIMSGLVATAYQLSQSARETSAKVVTEEEINFVLKKIDWALNGADSSTIATSLLPGELKFKNDSVSSNFISIHLNTENDVEVEIGSGVNLLTTKNVKVEDLDFSYNSGTKVITATFTIDGVSSNFTKLLKI